MRSEPLQRSLQVRRFRKPPCVGCRAAVVAAIPLPPSVVLGCPRPVIASLRREQLRLAQGPLPMPDELRRRYLGLGGRDFSLFGGGVLAEAAEKKGLVDPTVEDRDAQLDA